MKTTAAVVHEIGKPLEIEELDLAGPREREVLVRWTPAGLCHSDVHVPRGRGRLPMVGGHEGAGVVEEVGPGVTRVRAGDHIVCSFIPACGSCRYCSTGQQNHVRRGATPRRALPRRALSASTGRRRDFGGMCMLGTFASTW